MIGSISNQMCYTKGSMGLRVHLVFEVDYLEMNSLNEVGCLELICIYFQRWPLRPKGKVILMESIGREHPSLRIS